MNYKEGDLMSYLSKRAENNMRAVLAWTKREDVNKLICADKDALKIFIDFEVDLINLGEARTADNEKTWLTIKERRKSDKNYCRKRR